LVVHRYKGRGRKATAEARRNRGGWLYRLFMAWFGKGRRVRL
jgi:hypothetical protein